MVLLTTDSRSPPAAAARHRTLPSGWVGVGVEVRVEGGGGAEEWNGWEKQRGKQRTTNTALRSPTATHGCRPLPVSRGITRGDANGKTGRSREEGIGGQFRHACEIQNSQTNGHHFHFSAYQNFYYSDNFGSVVLRIDKPIIGRQYCRNKHSLSICSHQIILPPYLRLVGNITTSVSSATSPPLLLPPPLLSSPLHHHHIHLICRHHHHRYHTCHYPLPFLFPSLYHHHIHLPLPLLSPSRG